MRELYIKEPVELKERENTRGIEKKNTKAVRDLINCSDS